MSGAASPASRAADAPSASAQAAGEPFNVLIVGVGGQGVIMVSKLLALLAQSQGFEVKQSEVHGMAKGLRWLPYLRPDTGIFICDTKRIVPPFACLNRRPGAAMRYSGETPADVIAHVSEGYAIDATSLAEKLGNERAANVILLGALSTALNFPVAEWEKTVAAFVPKKTVAVNIDAFRRGRAWIEDARDAPHAEAPAPQVPADASYRVRVEITPEWCKSCDICVKMCPERCLRLDAERIVELVEPDRCTGCRLCEWLCPDFAIRIHLDAARAAITQGAAP
jgi:indolepyruvate ferredoxin oxidoreductase beta subunit